MKKSVFDRERTFNGKKYHYSENIARKSTANEVARTFRRAGALVRIIPLKKGKRATSYDMFVRY